LKRAARTCRLLGSFKCLSQAHRSDNTGRFRESDHTSDGVSRHGLGLETRLEPRFLKSRSRRSRLGLEAKHLGLELFVSSHKITAIKSGGRRYTISLLVTYTGNPELRSFCCSMLRPNNACRKHLILSFYQRKKRFSIQRQWLPAKDLPQL